MIVLVRFYLFGGLVSNWLCVQVASCFLVMEPRTQISRGFAFITMDSVEDANRCIKHLNQSVLEGRYITVEKVIGLLFYGACLAFKSPFIFLTREFPGYIQNILHHLCWQQSNTGSVSSNIVKQLDSWPA